jgi:hypothetical protein
MERSAASKYRFTAAETLASLETAREKGQKAQ